MPHTDLTLTLQGDTQQIAVIRLNRAAKRNALNDGLILALRDTFQNLPSSVRAAVIDGNGEHFCAGLDLSELQERDAGQGLHHSRMWHAALDCVQSGPVPVIAALHGAVVGGGLELASACHIRVADETAFFALPEGTRGIFVGGGGLVRIPKPIGVARMTDTMLDGPGHNAPDAREHFVPRAAAPPSSLPIVEGKHLAPFQLRLTETTQAIHRETAARLITPATSFDRDRIGYRDVAGATNRLPLVAGW